MRYLLYSSGADISLPKVPFFLIDTDMRITVAIEIPGKGMTI